ncbi:GNAT family N-acetyltransferase [Streptomyces sp. BE20]|uniref:GNAT family N-acetyltransferase n=1 Tax=Streptomyces sp. BE20 TaxID=3002525 RepID=UPI002E784AB9|nr:GNAT family N-acetyltransferase [Streptomyces sp. BE20]MEE1823656.1 GNAT family N-acetyltransferase [Streptomyces sp. BE20]
MYTVRRLAAGELRDSAGPLAELLVDTVGSGSSLGFLAPLDAAEAAGWWRALAPDVAAGRLLVWAAHHDADHRIAGTVQLRPATPANGRHRAEVAKLMVHRADRGRGLAGRLLTALESAAVEHGIRTLVLDTETGSPAERLYAAAGWTRVGTVPDYATDPSGTPHATTVFYKALPAEPAAGADVRPGRDKL